MFVFRSRKIAIIIYKIAHIYINIEEHISHSIIIEFHLRQLTNPKTTRIRHRLFIIIRVPNMLIQKLHNINNYANNNLCIL